MKATTDEYSIHRRMLENDPTAFAELCEWLYPTLVREVQARAGASADPDMVEEAVGEALLSYNAVPAAYDPEKMLLERYLVMAAYRDFQNAHAKELRRSGPGGPPLSLSEERLSDNLPDQQQDLDAIIADLNAQELMQRISLAFPDPNDQRIVTLLINRTRSSEPYAKLLGVTHLPEDQRTREVKRAKDRIMKRLRRMGEDLNEL